MKRSAKVAQLQIRVSASQKARIQHAARRAGLGMSAFVLGKVLPDQSVQWQERLRELAREDGSRVALAALSAWLARLGARELHDELAAPPPATLSALVANYVAAMVEQVCAANGVDAPRWTREIAPLEHPLFGSELASLRLHLLAHSPPPFRRRNIFIDTAVGGQV